MCNKRDPGTVNKDGGKDELLLTTIDRYYDDVNTTAGFYRSCRIVLHYGWDCCRGVQNGPQFLEHCTGVI